MRHSPPSRKNLYQWKVLFCYFLFVLYAFFIPESRILCEKERFRRLYKTICVRIYLYTTRLCPHRTKLVFFSLYFGGGIVMKISYPPPYPRKFFGFEV